MDDTYLFSSSKQTQSHDNESRFELTIILIELDLTTKQSINEKKTCLNKKMNNLAYDYYGIQFTTRSEIQTSTDELHLVIIYFIWIENNLLLSTKRECTKKLMIIIHFHFHFYM
jgi:hypothetical protein